MCDDGISRFDDDDYAAATPAITQYTAVTAAAATIPVLLLVGMLSNLPSRQSWTGVAPKRVSSL